MSLPLPPYALPDPPDVRGSDPSHSLPPKTGPSAAHHPPTHRRVLVVDPSDDNREVLRTALQRRGIDTLDTGQPAVGLAWARQHAPDVIVLDTDWDEALAAEICREYESEVQRGTTRVLMLGLPRASLALQQAADGPRLARVSKPYHYGPLIRKIEEMIANPQ